MIFQTVPRAVGSGPLPGPSAEPFATLADVHRDVPAHPDLSLQEHRTAGIAAAWPTARRYDVTEGIGGNGVVGVLRNGDGPTVLEMHVAWLLGTAWDVPTVSWVVGGVDPATYARAQAARTLDEPPATHAPEFAPVIDLTPRTGIEAMLAAVGAWTAVAEAGPP